VLLPELVRLSHAGEYAVLLHRRFDRNSLRSILRKQRLLLHVQRSSEQHDDHHQRLFPGRLRAGRSVPVYHAVAPGLETSVGADAADAGVGAAADADRKHRGAASSGGCPLGTVGWTFGWVVRAKVRAAEAGAGPTQAR